MKTVLKIACRVCLVCLVLLVAGLTLSEPLQAQPPVVYGTAQAAVRVIGQPDFATALPGFESSQLGAPTSMTIAGKKLIVADGGNAFLGPQNSRVLIYNDYTKVARNTPADVVIGQTGFGSTCSVAAGQTSGGTMYNAATSNVPCQVIGTSQSQMNLPTGISSDGVRLAIADSANNRVLIYNTIPTANGANADIVLGQPSFTSNAAATTQSGMRFPGTVLIALGKLFVADTFNHRVLIYNTIPTSNNANADVVLGQPNFTSHTALATPTSSSMVDPVSVSTDGTRLIVTDLGNNRVLIYNKIPTQNGQAADLEIGEPDFVTANADTGSNNLNFPRDAFSDGQRLIISDSGNNRILVYNTFPTTNGAFPDAIIGQYDSIGHLEGLAVEKLANPVGLTPLPGGGFLVADGNNRRVVEFQPGQPWFNKGYVFDAASRNGNGLPKPVNVQASVSVDNTGSVLPGTYYARVSASYSAFPRESAVSDEIKVNVPAANTAGSTIKVTWNGVTLPITAATPADSYRVYFGRVSNLEDRFASADLTNATATALIIGGTPAVGDTISITITNDDATTFTITYTAVTNDTVGTIGDNLANLINTNSANSTHGVTATSDKKGTITWKAKESGSVGNSCTYQASVTTGTGTQISPNNILTQFSGASDATNVNQLTLNTYPVDPTLAGSFGNQRPYDNTVPGSILMIQGVFPNNTTATATSTPLPLTLGGTSVWANGFQCPMVSVSNTQIQFQIPVELTGTSAGIRVQQTLSNGTTSFSLAIPVSLTLPQPSIYSADGTGIGNIMALHPDGTVISPTSPAAEGEQVTFFGTGFGLLSDYPKNAVASLITTSGALVVGSYYMRATAIFPDGSESFGSGEVLLSVSTGNTNSAALVWDPTPGAVKYRVYMGNASLTYDRYYETDTNGYTITSLVGIPGTPPVQTNVPGNGVLSVATTQQVQVQSNVCPTNFMGPNPGVVGVWRVTCTIPSTISASDLSMSATDTYGSAEVHAIIGAIDSNHVYIPLKRPLPTYFTITPSLLNFTGIAGSTTTASQPVTVNKLGGGTLAWTASINTTDGGTWLTADVLSGTNTSGMTITADPSTLSPGTYYGTITVTGTGSDSKPVLDANGNPLTVVTNVNFFVTASGASPQRRTIRH
jgi:uncharacterized protein (TIGR03437 family)